MSAILSAIKPTRRPGGDHAPEDSLYVWDPNPPDCFTHNAEA
jgi:hypothetical protein